MMKNPRGQAAALSGDGATTGAQPAMILWALKYARIGVPVFPVHGVNQDGSCTCGNAACKNIGKHPVTPNGSKAATTDLNTIRARWKAHPRANIGTVPCLAIPALVALDFDPRNGSDDTLASLEREHAPFVRTVVCRTGGGGEHVYFLASEGVSLPGKLGPGIDVQHKGYVILPPSAHRSGNRYQWIEGKSLLDADNRDFLCPLPSWVQTANGGSVEIASTAAALDPMATIDPTEEETPEKVGLVLSALKHLDPEGSRDTYMTVLRAFAASGWDDAFERYARRWARGDMHNISARKYDERTFDRDCRDLSNDRPGPVATFGSLFKQAEAAGWSDPRKARAIEHAAPAEGVAVIRAADIKPEPVRWTWEGWLARGKLAILAGQPGTGKTTIAMACVAVASKGGKWPDDTTCAAGDVLIWSGEDDPKDTLVPRLIAAGADLNRVHFVGAASDGLDSRPFDPSRDMPALLARATEIGTVRMLIVDPIVSAVAGDSHKNAEVRRALAPLITFAEATDAALLGVTHFTKGTSGRDPLERVTGSVAFGAVARIVWVTARMKDNDGEFYHVLARAKSNIGPDDGGFRYSFDQVPLPAHPGITASRIEWGLALIGHARDLLAEPEERKEGPRRDDAGTWLESVLKAGPVLVGQIKEQAEAAGHAWRTVERAKVWRGVRSRRRGSGNRAPFEWVLPADSGVEEDDEL